ncbi:MAG TPA: hypothetical protein VJU82_05900 [Acidobacteriaceae bacterium]|nr:hypothetical protein [Acidobacteriaceae bacterium]
MTDWPSWIQAAAAILQAAAAIVIYRVTKEYVQLTRDIARASNEQLKLTRRTQLAEDVQRAAALRGQASSLEARANALPEHADDTAFRQRPLWTDEEVEGLQAAAPRVLGMAADAASRASEELTWLRDRVAAVRETSPSQGYDYNRFFPTSEWPARRAAALQSLRELMRYSAVAAALAEEHAKALDAGASK